jgi:hypothetical protein
LHGVEAMHLLVPPYLLLLPLPLLLVLLPLSCLLPVLLPRLLVLSQCLLMLSRLHPLHLMIPWLLLPPLTLTRHPFQLMGLPSPPGSGVKRVWLSSWGNNRPTLIIEREG